MRIKTLLIALVFLSSSVSYATIKIGTLMFKPPYILSPGNGFDVDFGHLICKYLQEECKFIPMGMEELYDQLHKGEIDLAMGGIPISYSLKINFIFSLPYMLSKGQFLILKDNPINSINGLRGKTIGVLRNILNGGVFYNYLQAHNQEQLQIKLFDDIEDIMAALNDNSLSAAFLDRSSVNYWILEGGDQFHSLGKVHTIGDGIAILALPKNKQLIQRINAVIQTIEKDGSYSKLYETYFANE